MAGSERDRATARTASDEARRALFDHDIRSALADILGGLDGIDSGGLSSDARAQLDRVRGSAAALSRLLDGALREATDPDLSRDALALSDVALVDLLRDVRSRWHGHARSQGLTLDTDLAADLPILIRTDPTALERILANVIGNALKYAERGAITLRVDLRDGADLRFSVLDEGPGLSSAALDRLFARHGRPAESARPGTGVGLHISKILADRLGGRFEVANRPGGGAAVTLTLPQAVWGGAALQVDLRDGLDGLRVLIAEDTDSNRQILSEMLGHLGIVCETAADGRAAFERLAAGGYDLALVDIQMPRMSGVEVIRAVRALPGQAGRVPLLAVTAYVLREHRDEIYRAGADGILAKPLTSLHALAQALRAVVRKVRDQGGSVGMEEDRASVTRIDTARLEELIDVAGPDGRAELLRRLDNDLTRNLAGLVRSLEAENAQELRGQTHILISLSGAVGSEGLQRMAEHLNRACQEGRSDELRRCTPIAVEGLEALLAEIRARRKAEEGT